jgi:Flp pilus assembly pilin Flp
MGKTDRAVQLPDAACGRSARGIFARLSLSAVRRSEGGATAIEYALIAALMAVTVIASIAALAPGVGDLLGGVAGAFPDIT